MWLLLLISVLTVYGDFIRFDYDKTDSALLDNDVVEFIICMETCKKSDQCCGIVFNVDQVTCTFKYEEILEDVMSEWGACPGDTAESTSRKTDDHSESSPSQPTSSVTTTGMNTPETSLSFPSDSPGNPSTTPFDNINLNSNTETPIPVSHLNSTTERSKRESENASTTTTIPTTTAFDYYFKLKEIRPPSVECNDDLRICNCDPSGNKDMRITLADGVYFSAQSIEQSSDRRLWTLKGTVRNSEGVSVEVTRNILSIECQHFGRSFTADSSKIYAFVIQNGYFEGRKVICPKGYAAVSAPNKAGFSFSKLKAELLPYGWYSWPYGPYQIKAVYCNK
ncbi:hypothetical protein PRIPAC_87791 [Pristionchus pacificus]|uniref:Uncharacterized protein n=1 Tax=Pristionchus pacificus TaxID=54126 RepID=A0A2A6B8Q7_PRIPA|nr:hypothetical protein PRIPAC_87791 [Pristionchus pacificus]|eukprot:PDM62270.1 hypothetical protein PRIPAC_51712 [Pristionchus pacificus]